MKYCYFHYQSVDMSHALSYVVLMQDIESKSKQIWLPFCKYIMLSAVL